MTRWADGSSFLAGPSLERSYSVPVNLPQPGPVCIVVTAATLDVPLATATRRVVIPDANHLLVPATLGLVSEYALLPSFTIAPQVGETIISWLNETLPQR